MISNKIYTADGSTRAYLSDFIIKSEQYCRVYNFKYDPNGVDGDIDPTTGLYIRVDYAPKAEDQLNLNDWQLVDNLVSFYSAPKAGTTLFIEVATTPEELGEALAGSAVIQAETARDLAEQYRDASNVSATNAATSESNASLSATASANSATASATSATNSANSATASSNSATAAATSEANASTSETNAATSATNASTSETNASTSETNASNSATAAANSATSASTSATNAANSATAAATSETNAAASAALAATFDPTSYYDKTTLDGGQLDNRYYTETEVDTSLALKADQTTLDTKLNATNPSITGSITEEVATLTGNALEPDNGTIQTLTLTADTTLTDGLADGQSMLVSLTGGDAYVVTYPTTTWVDGVAPTLTASDMLVFYKIGTTLYGKYIGSTVQV